MLRASAHCAALIGLLLAVGCSETAQSGTAQGGASSLAGGPNGGAAGAAGSSGAGGTAGAAVGGDAAASGSSNLGGTAGVSAQGGAGGGLSAGDTFRVNGRFLYDRCGEQVLLRGINEMIVWSAGKDGLPEYAEIAKTGANVVRIVWTKEGSAAELDVAIANAVQQNLIPLIEDHDATGKLENVPAVVDYWTQADVVQVLLKHQGYLLLNIANEAGDDKVTQQSFESTYGTAISRIRATGVKLPLIIDAPSWGQDIDRLQASGPTLLQQDPLHNLMFSVHMWWADPDGTRVKKELQESVDSSLPLLVGEFAQHAVYLCDQSPFAYGVLLDEAQKQGIGWLAWSWGSVPNSDCKGMGPFDMTTDGTFANWSGTWASDVTLNHPHSIKNTSVRPKSMLTGKCQ